MDHPSDASSTTSLQLGIKKLLQIGHSAAALCCQIQETANIFAEVVTPENDSNPTGKAIVEGVVIMDNLTTAELMELANLENTRQALVKSWRYVESRKAKVIQQANARIAEQGGPVNEAD